MSPSSAVRCDCGYHFEPASTERRTCPDCDSVWPPGAPRCSCGAWLDDEARRANVMFADLMIKGWVALGMGVLVIVVPLLPPLRALGIGRLAIIWLILAGALVMKGLRAIAYARNGLARHAPPRRRRAAKPPEARVVRRADDARRADDDVRRR
jgi:hypothetical protein